MIQQMARLPTVVNKVAAAIQTTAHESPADNRDVVDGWADPIVVRLTAEGVIEVLLLLLLLLSSSSIDDTLAAVIEVALNQDEQISSVLLLHSLLCATESQSHRYGNSAFPSNNHNYNSKSVCCRLLQ